MGEKPGGVWRRVESSRVWSRVESSMESRLGSGRKEGSRVKGVEVEVEVETRERWAVGVSRARLGSKPRLPP